MPDMFGPYEIMHQRKFGCLSKGIWNLRVEESRSGLLWQVLSGLNCPLYLYLKGYLES